MSSSSSEFTIVEEEFNILEALMIAVFCFLMGFAYCIKDEIVEKDEPTGIDINALTSREMKRLVRIEKEIKKEMDKMAQIDKELKILEEKLPTSQWMRKNIDSQ